MYIGVRGKGGEGMNVFDMAFKELPSRGLEAGGKGTLFPYIYIHKISPLGRIYMRNRFWW